MAVAGYWMLAFGWGWWMVKISDAWFYVLLIVSSILCGFGGMLIEKLHKSICNIEVLRAKKMSYLNGQNEIEDDIT